MLPRIDRINQPPRSDGTTLEWSLADPEAWTLRFSIEDALPIVETLSAVAAQIVDLMKENKPK